MPGGGRGGVVSEPGGGTRRLGTSSVKQLGIGWYSGLLVAV